MKNGYQAGCQVEEGVFQYLEIVASKITTKSATCTTSTGTITYIIAFNIFLSNLWKVGVREAVC